MLVAAHAFEIFIDTEHEKDGLFLRLNSPNEGAQKATSRAIGEELRRARDAEGLSRAQFVSALPSGIGDRTLLSYEHGTRHLTVLRFIELCDALNIPASRMLTMALQRARLHLQNLVLYVDLRYVLNDRSEKFRPMHQWARNKLNEHPDGVAELPPSSVNELATFVGCTYTDLANHLAQFIPEKDDAQPHATSE